MAYFDSPKNRAMWEKELSGLKEEKARREKGIMPDRKKDDKSAVNSKDASLKQDKNREKTSFKELMKEEAAASSKQSKMPKTRSKEKNAMEKHAQDKEYKGPSL